jgi:hypothetical protein
MTEIFTGEDIEDQNMIVVVERLEPCEERSWRTHPDDTSGCPVLLVC